MRLSRDCRLCGSIRSLVRIRLQGDFFKADNGRDHRVATNKLNIKIRDNRDFGASNGYHDSLWDGLPDHRPRLNQRLVPGALRLRR